MQQHKKIWDAGALIDLCATVNKDIFFPWPLFTPGKLIAHKHSEPQGNLDKFKPIDINIQNILKELKTLTTNPSLRKKRRPEAADRIDELKGQLIKILNKSQWQTAGLPKLSDKEGLDRAYNNSENIYYDKMNYKRIMNKLWNSLMFFS